MATDVGRAAARLPAVLVLLVLGLLALGAEAHLLNMSKARIELLADGRVEVRLKLDLLLTAGSREAYFRLSRQENPLAQDAVQRLLSPLPSAIELTLGGQRIPLSLKEMHAPEQPREVFLDPLRWPRTELLLEGQLSQLAGEPSHGGLQVVYTDAFRFEEPIANTFIDTRSEQSQTRWLVTGQTSPVFEVHEGFEEQGATPSTSTVDWPGVLDFLRAGFLHILPGGVDHLLFVAGLCLGAESLRRLVAIVSLFTLAHSLTLCAMALGWVDAPSQFVELMILLSILWVAITNLRSPRPGRSRWPIVLGFGLLHGLGFAGALIELGLPSNQLLAALVAFNFGVEVGQLAFLGALLVTLSLLRKPVRVQVCPQAGHGPLPVPEMVQKLGATVIGALAIWLLIRLLW